VYYFLPVNSVNQVILAVARLRVVNFVSVGGIDDFCVPIMPLHDDFVPLNARFAELIALKILILCFEKSVLIG
jgi:hypothetical protein